MRSDIHFFFSSTDSNIVYCFLGLKKRAKLKRKSDIFLKAVNQLMLG